MDNKFLTELIFPPRCMFCGAVLASGKKCSPCRVKAEHFALSNRQINLSNFKNLDSCISFYLYDDIVRDGILYAKFRSCSGFIREFLSYTDFDFKKFFEENGTDEIISVPYHRSKLYNTEYDLPQQMAQTIAKNCGVRYNKDLVIKTRKTDNQHNLSLKERRSNLKDAFRLNGDVKGKNIVIIDDIVTTGYSMEEVARTLKKGGAYRVTGIAFAYNKG